MPKISSYQGKPMLTLNPEDRYIFTFGLPKARLILDNLEAIRAFVESNGRTCEPPSQMRLHNTSGSEKEEETISCGHCGHEDPHYKMNGEMQCSRSDCNVCNFISPF